MTMKMNIVPEMEVPKVTTKQKFRFFRQDQVFFDRIFSGERRIEQEALGRSMGPLIITKKCFHVTVLKSCPFLA